MGKPSVPTKKNFEQRDLENRVSHRVTIGDASLQIAERIQLAQVELQHAMSFRQSALQTGYVELIEEAQRQIDSIKFVVTKLRQEQEALTAERRS